MVLRPAARPLLFCSALAKPVLHVGHHARTPGRAAHIQSRSASVHSLRAAGLRKLRLYHRAIYWGVCTVCTRSERTVPISTSTLLETPSAQCGGVLVLAPAPAARGPVKVLKPFTLDRRGPGCRSAAACRCCALRRPAPQERLVQAHSAMAGVAEGKSPVKLKPPLPGQVRPPVLASKRQPHFVASSLFKEHAVVKRHTLQCLQ